jgi:prefoldin subunit 5
MPAAESWTIGGVGVCLGSSVLAVIDGSNPIVVGFGIAAGIAMGIVGLYQKMMDQEVKRLHKRIERLDTTIDDLQSKLDTADSTIRELRCPYAVEGRARCHDEDKRELPSA